MKILQKLFAFRSAEKSGDSRIALHSMLADLIKDAVECGNDACLPAEKAAQAFAKGLAAYDKECSAPSSAKLRSDP